MNGNEYQKLANRTNDKKSSMRAVDWIVDRSYPDKGGIINGCLGLCGEAGEFSDMVKKWCFHEAELDEDHAKKELGDVLWYVSLIAESFGWKLSEIMKMNIDKLKKRYPDGFSTYDSAHRQEGDI